MDIKKTFHMHSRKKRNKSDTAQLAAELAPLEELDSRVAATQLGSSSSQPVDPLADPHYGAIVVDNEGLHVPKDIMEGGDEKTYLGMEPVVLVILGFMLLFIAFIAWQISLMPVE
jgi:hypothetical protein